MKDVEAKKQGGRDKVIRMQAERDVGRVDS